MPRIPSLSAAWDAASQRRGLSNGMAAACEAAGEITAGSGLGGRVRDVP